LDGAFAIGLGGADDEVAVEGVVAAGGGGGVACLEEDDDLVPRVWGGASVGVGLEFVVGADVPEAELAVGGVVDGATVDGLAGLGGVGGGGCEDEEGCEGVGDSHGGGLRCELGRG